GPHHPGVSEEDVQSLDRFARGHRCGSGQGVSRDGPSLVEATAAGFGLSDAFLCASTSSLEKSTRAAPRPTSTIPTQSFQPGSSTLKWKGFPGSGCQTVLTSVLIMGARPKINGAMKARYVAGFAPASVAAAVADFEAKMTHM